MSEVMNVGVMNVGQSTEVGCCSSLGSCCCSLNTDQENDNNSLTTAMVSQNPEPMPRSEEGSKAPWKASNILTLRAARTTVPTAPPPPGLQQLV